MKGSLLLVIAGVAAMVLISRAIPNSARSGGSPYTAGNLAACALIALAGTGAAFLIVVSGGLS